MGTTIYRGSTPTIKLTPTNGMNVEDLGEPTVAIAQELVFITPDVEIDTEKNCVVVKLTEEETLSLVEGAETEIQQMWKNGDDVIRFPVHKITVAKSLVEELIEVPTPEPEVDQPVETGEVTEATEEESE